MCEWGLAALGEGKGEVLPQGMCTHTHNKIRLLRKTRFWVGVRQHVLQGPRDKEADWKV